MIQVPSGDPTVIVAPLHGISTLRACPLPTLTLCRPQTVAIFPPPKPTCLPST